VQLGPACLLHCTPLAPAADRHGQRRCSCGRHGVAAPGCCSCCCCSCCCCQQPRRPRLTGGAAAAALPTRPAGTPQSATASAFTGTACTISAPACQHLGSPTVTRAAPAPRDSAGTPTASKTLLAPGTTARRGAASTPRAAPTPPAHAATNAAATIRLRRHLHRGHPRQVRQRHRSLPPTPLCCLLSKYCHGVRPCVSLSLHASRERDVWQPVPERSA
jgi:hypothetical protein